MERFHVIIFRHLLIALLAMCCNQSLSAQDWVSIPGIKADDIGIGKNGSVWITAEDGSIHRWDGSKFERMPGNAKRVAVAPDGNAWVVNSGGEIYRFNNATNEYTLIDGGAHDIGVGADGSVWLIGMGVVPGGYEIYQWNGASWDKRSGGAVRIAVDPDGNAWVVNDAGIPRRWSNEKWQSLSGEVQDIGIGADGSVWCTGKGSGAVRQWTGSSWVQKSGGGRNIAVSPAGNPWVVNADGVIYRSGQTNIPTSQANTITAYIRGLTYDARTLLSIAENGSSEAIPTGGTKDRKSTGNGVVICTKKAKKLDEKMDKISILKPNTGVIFPGALVLANRKLAEGLPTPITLKRAPVTLRVDLPGLVNNGTKVVKYPKNDNIQTAINEVLEEWNTKPAAEGYVNASNSISRIQKAYSSEQLALSLGFRLDWAGNNVSAAAKVSTSSENEVTVAFFQQIFYTITMNPPEHPADLFDPSVSLADIQTVMNHDNPPAYIRSVDYGRTIMVRMETSKRATSVELEAALKYAADPTTTISADLKAKYGNVWSNSTFTVYSIGGNAQVATQIIGGTDISGLRNVIKTDAVYRRNNPGVPIAYTVAFLKDNQTASVNSSVGYVETECIEYPNAFVKLVHDGVYVGRFDVSWQEPNEKGIHVTKSWSSGEKTIGYSYTLTLPGDAVNITIKGEAATGLVWDPWGEAISQVLPSPNNCTYTIQGTSLLRSFKKDCP